MFIYNKKSMSHRRGSKYFSHIDSYSIVNSINLRSNFMVANENRKMKLVT